MKRIMQAVTLMFLLAVSASAATYYIDFVGGSNANAGTSKAAPWKLAPGMPGFVQPSYVHKPGDQFIFKGAVTWPKTALPLTIKYSGAAGAMESTAPVAANGPGTPTAPASPLLNRITIL